ncbi:hypothetical protein B4114_0388 [Geobacillus stearothermophilus]|uniref:Uncharacterized protein n=1 Tax=Geobacillus stearothermophilus TaxID=1422 RepID=A0A150NEX3_GEOSE|nr:hypothetical protein B4114_0388 [Geobacillus stearothermophilus]
MFQLYNNFIKKCLLQLYKKMPSSSGAPFYGDAGEHLARQLFF